MRYINSRFTYYTFTYDVLNRSAPARQQNDTSNWRQSFVVTEFISTGINNYCLNCWRVTPLWPSLVVGDGTLSRRTKFEVSSLNVAKKMRNCSTNEWYRHLGQNLELFASVEKRGNFFSRLILKSLARAAADATKTNDGYSSGRSGISGGCHKASTRAK